MLYPDEYIYISGWWVGDLCSTVSLAGRRRIRSTYRRLKKHRELSEDFYCSVQALPSVPMRMWLQPEATDTKQLSIVTLDQPEGKRPPLHLCYCGTRVRVYVR